MKDQFSKVEKVYIEMYKTTLEKVIHNELNAVVLVVESKQSLEDRMKDMVDYCHNIAYESMRKFIGTFNPTADEAIEEEIGKKNEDLKRQIDLLKKQVTNLTEQREGDHE